MKRFTKSRMKITGMALAAILLAAAFASSQAPNSNYSAQGGANWVVGGSLDIASTGVFSLAGTPITATAAEINTGAHGAPASFTFTPAAASANVSEITITVKDGTGATVASVVNFDLWLSDTSTCEGLTATTASGTVAAKTSSGTDLAVLTAKKATRVQSKATGVYILSVTDTGKTHFYVCGQVPGNGRSIASAQLTSANYG